MAPKVTHITGRIHFTDGTEHSFSINADLGWQQWDANTEQAAKGVYVMDALTEVLGEYMGEEGEGEDEGEFTGEDAEELARLEVIFEEAGGRGVELAEEIDRLRRKRDGEE